MIIAACSSLASTPAPPVSVDVAYLTPTALPTPTPTRTPIPSATPTVTPAPTQTPLPSDVWIDPSGVRVHPDGGLYTGDVLSFQVEAHNGSDADLSHVPVVVDWGSGQARSSIYHLASSGSSGVDFTWVWDTTSISATHAVTVTVDPDNVTGDPDRSNNVAVIHVNLVPNRPSGEIGARWQTTTSTCCLFHYISGTAAERDIQSIVQTAGDAIAFVADRLHTRPTRPLEVYLINRVLGHGGFAGDTIAISYLDRDYSGGGLLEVFRHEATHVLDHNIAGGERPALFVEGFAVYVTGGHFKLESLPERAAALLKAGRYAPLRNLADDFYRSQHETGYLEGGAFIDYLIGRSGYDKFISLYDGMKREPGESDAALIDREMRAVYGIGLDAMEHDWQAHLRTLAVGDEERDVVNTIAFYDTVRRYQRVLDPSAYFLNAWMPDLQQAFSRGRVADYARHPRAPENIALETMLVSAHDALLAREFDRVGTLLASINAVLDANVTFADPIAARYMQVVRASLASGYEPQRIGLDGNRADVWATSGGGPNLVRLSAARIGDAWSVRLSQ